MRVLFVFSLEENWPENRALQNGRVHEWKLELLLKMTLTTSVRVSRI
jgi:hypothetical protein